MGVAASSQLVFIAVERPFNLTPEEDDGVYAEIAVDEDVYEINSWPAPPVTVVLDRQGPELLMPPKLLRCTFWTSDDDSPTSKKRRQMEVLIPQSSIEEFGQPALQLWLGLLDRSEMPSERYPPEEQAKFLFEASLQAAKTRWRPKVCITIAATAEDLRAPSPRPTFNRSCFRSCDGSIGDACTGRCEVVPLYLEDEQDPFDGALDGPVMRLLKHSGDIIKELHSDFRMAERDLMYTRKEFKSKEMIYHGQVANLLGNKRDLRVSLMRVRDFVCENWLQMDSLFHLQRSFSTWSKATFSGSVGALRELLPALHTPRGAIARKLEQHGALPSTEALKAKQLLGLVLQGSAMELRVAFHFWRDVSCVVQKRPNAVQASPKEARRACINRMLALLESAGDSYALHVIFFKWSEQVIRSDRMDMESVLLVDRRRGRQVVAQETVALLEPVHQRHLLRSIFLKWCEVLLRGHKVDMENLLLASQPRMCEAHFSRVAWALHRCAEDQSTLQLQTCFVGWQRLCAGRSRKALQCGPAAGDAFTLACTFHCWSRLARRAREKANILRLTFMDIDRYALSTCFAAWRRCGGKRWRKALVRCISAGDAFLFAMAFRAWARCSDRCREEATSEEHRTQQAAELQRRHDHIIGMAAEWLDGTHVTMLLQEIMRGWLHCTREDAHSAVLTDLRKLKGVHDLQSERVLQLMDMDERDFQRRHYFQRWRSSVAEAKQERERTRLEVLQSCLSEAKLRNGHSLQKVLLRLSQDGDGLLLRCILQAWGSQTSLTREVAAARDAESQLQHRNSFEHQAQCRSIEAQLEAVTVRADCQRDTHRERVSKVVQGRLSVEDCGHLTLVFLSWRHHALNEKMEAMLKSHLEAAERLTAEHKDALSAKEQQLEAARGQAEQLRSIQEEELTANAKRGTMKLRQIHGMSLYKLVDHLTLARSTTSLGSAFARWREHTSDSARVQRLSAEQQRRSAVLEGSWSAWCRLSDHISLRMAFHAWVGELSQKRTLEACRRRGERAQRLVASLALEHLTGGVRCVFVSWKACASESACEAQAKMQTTSAKQRHCFLLERSLAAWGQSEDLITLRWLLHMWASRAAHERQREACRRRGERAQRLVASLALEHSTGGVRCVFLSWKAHASESACEAQAKSHVTSAKERHRFLLERSLAAWGQSESLITLRWILHMWASRAAHERQQEARRLQSASMHKFVDYLFVDHLAGSLRSAFCSWRERAADGARAAGLERRLCASRERYTAILERSLAAWGQGDLAGDLQRLFHVWTMAAAQERQLKLCRLQSSRVHKLVDYLALEHLAGGLRAAFLSWKAQAADLVSAARHDRQLASSRERHQQLLERSLVAWGRSDSLGPLQVVLRSWRSAVARERQLKVLLFFRAWCEVIQEQKLAEMKEALMDATAQTMEAEHQRAHRLLDYLILDHMAGALRTSFLYWREFAASSVRMSQFDRQLLVAREHHHRLIERSLATWTQGDARVSLQMILRNWMAEVAKQHKHKVAFWFRAWRRVADAELQTQLHRLRSARTQKIVEYVMLTHAAGSLRSTLYWWRQHTEEAARAAQLDRRPSGIQQPHCLVLEKALMVWMRGDRAATLQVVLNAWRIEVHHAKELQAHRKQLRHLQSERAQKILDCMIVECMMGALASTFLSWREQTAANRCLSSTEEQHKAALERSMLLWMLSENRAAVQMMLRLWSAEGRRARRFKALFCFRAWCGAVEDARQLRLRQLESARLHKVVDYLMLEHVAGGLRTAFLCWRERAQADRRRFAAEARQELLLERSILAWAQGSSRSSLHVILTLWATAAASERGLKARSMHAREVVELLALHLMAGSLRSSFLCWREHALSEARARQADRQLASVQMQHCQVLERSLMMWVHSDSTVSVQMALHVWWAEARRMRQLKAQQLELLRLQSGRAQRLVDALVVTHMVGGLQSTFLCWREHTAALRSTAKCDRLLFSAREDHSLMLEKSLLVWVQNDGRSALQLIVRSWSTEARRRRLFQVLTYFRAWSGLVEAARQTQIHRLQSRRAHKFMDYLMLQQMAGCLSSVFLSWKEHTADVVREAKYASDYSVERTRHRRALERSVLAWAQADSKASLHIIMRLWSAEIAGRRQLKAQQLELRQLQSGHTQRVLEYLLMDQLAGSLRSSFSCWRQHAASQVRAAQNEQLLSSTRKHDHVTLERSLLVWVRGESKAALQIMLHVWSSEARRNRLLQVQLYFRSWCSAVEAARHAQLCESRSACTQKLVDYLLLEHIAGSLRSAFQCWREQAAEFALAAQFGQKLEQQGQLVERSVAALLQDSSMTFLQMLFHIWRAEAAGSRQTKAQRAHFRQLQSGCAERLVDYVLLEHLAGSLRSSFTCWREHTLASKADQRLVSSEEQHGLVLERSLLLWVRSESMSGLQMLFCLWRSEAERTRELKVRQLEFHRLQSGRAQRLVDFLVLDQMAGSLRSTFSCWREHTAAVGQSAMGAHRVSKLQEQHSLALERSLLMWMHGESLAALQMIFHLWAAELGWKHELKARQLEQRRRSSGKAQRLMEFLVLDQMAGSLRSSFASWRQHTEAQARAAQGDRVLSMVQEQEHLKLERSMMVWVHGESMAALQIVLHRWSSETRRKRQLAVLLYFRSWCAAVEATKRMQLHRLQSGRVHKLVDYLVLEHVAGSARSVFRHWRELTLDSSNRAKFDRELSRQGVLLERSVMAWVQDSCMALQHMVFSRWQAAAAGDHRFKAQQTRLRQLHSSCTQRLMDYLLLDEFAGALRSAFTCWREHARAESRITQAARCMVASEDEHGLRLERSLMLWAQGESRISLQMILCLWWAEVGSQRQLKAQQLESRRSESSRAQKLMDYLLLDQMAGSLRSSFSCWREHTQAVATAARSEQRMSSVEAQHILTLEKSVMLWGRGEGVAALQVVVHAWAAEAVRKRQRKVLSYFRAWSGAVEAARQLEMHRLQSRSVHRLVEHLMVEHVAGLQRSIFLCWREHAAELARAARQDRELSRHHHLLERSLMAWVQGDTDAMLHRVFFVWSNIVAGQRQLKAQRQKQFGQREKLVDYLALNHTAIFCLAAWREAASEAQRSSAREALAEVMAKAAQGAHGRVSQVLGCLLREQEAGLLYWAVSFWRGLCLQGQLERVQDVNSRRLRELFDRSMSAWMSSDNKTSAQLAFSAWSGGVARARQLKEQEAGLLHWAVSSWRGITLQAQLERAQDGNSRRLRELFERSMVAWIFSDNRACVQLTFSAWLHRVTRARQLKEHTKNVESVLSLLQPESHIMSLVLMFKEWVDFTEEARNATLLTKATEMGEKLQKLQDRRRDGKEDVSPMQTGRSPSSVARLSPRGSKTRSPQLGRSPPSFEKFEKSASFGRSASMIVAMRQASSIKAAVWQTWGDRQVQHGLFQEWRYLSLEERARKLRTSVELQEDSQARRLADATSQRATLVLTHKGCVHRLLEKCFRSEVSEDLVFIFSQWRLHASTARKDAAVRLALHESNSRLVDNSLAAWGAQLDRELLTEAIFAWQAGAAECRAFVAKSECRAAQEAAEERLSSVSAKAERLRQAHWEDVLKLLQQRMIGICFRCWVSHASGERQARDVGGSASSSISRMSDSGNGSLELKGEGTKLLLRTVEHENRALQQLLFLRGWRDSMRTSSNGFGDSQPAVAGARPAVKRLIFGILSFEGGITLRMVFVGWREHVSHQQKLDFCQAQLTADLRTGNLVDVACLRWQASEARMILRTVLRTWRGCLRRTPRSYRTPRDSPGSSEKVFKAHLQDRAAFASSLIDSTEKGLLPSAVKKMIGGEVSALQEQCKVQNNELEDLSIEVARLEQHFAKATLFLNDKPEHVAPEVDIDTKMLFEHCTLQSKQLRELECELDLLHAKMAATQEEVANASSPQIDARGV